MDSIGSIATTLEAPSCCQLSKRTSRSSDPGRPAECGNRGYTNPRPRYCSLDSTHLERPCHARRTAARPRFANCVWRAASHWMTRESVVHWLTRQQGGQDLFGLDPCWNRVGEHRRLRGQSIEGRELKPWKPAFIHLLIREFIEQDPDDPWSPRLCWSLIRLVVQRQHCVQRAGMPAQPCVLRQNHDPIETREDKQGRCKFLELLKPLFEIRSPQQQQDWKDSQPQTQYQNTQPMGNIRMRYVSTSS